jgi:hypothetical protein
MSLLHGDAITEEISIKPFLKMQHEYQISFGNGLRFIRIESSERKTACEIISRKRFFQGSPMVFLSKRHSNKTRLKTEILNSD